MTRQKFLKVLWSLCIITLILPFISTVLATTTQANNETASIALRSESKREGGDESSGTLSNDNKSLYDTEQYRYEIMKNAGTSTATYETVYKIVAGTTGDVDYSNTFYCLDKTKSFPGATDSSIITYNNKGDFSDETIAQSLYLSKLYTEDQTTWNKNYKAIKYLTENMYLRHQASSEKTSYLTKMFSDYITAGTDTIVLNVEDIKALLTDDDIDVVQQIAIWYFTNSDEFSISSLQEASTSGTHNTLKVFLSNYNSDGTENERESMNTGTVNAERQKLMNVLLEKLVLDASAASITADENTKVTPSLSEDATVKLDGSNYVVGPFKISKGDYTGDLAVKVLGKSNSEIARDKYSIIVDGTVVDPTSNISEILDKDIYISIPKTETEITEISLSVSYEEYGTTTTLFASDSSLNQPAILINRGNDVKTIISTTYPIKHADLALRKYIVSVNGEKVNRAPEVDTTPLKDDDANTTTAIYSHTKTPVEVNVGDKVVYEIRVYNEGNCDATVNSIVDTLPYGLELATNSTINNNNVWKIFDTSKLVGTTNDSLEDEEENNGSENAVQGETTNNSSATTENKESSVNDENGSKETVQNGSEINEVENEEKNSNAENKATSEEDSVENEENINGSESTVQEETGKSLTEVEAENKSNINKTICYTENETLSNTVLKAYDKENDQLDSIAVQIECVVTENALKDTILTNIAEILGSSIENEDIDSNVVNNSKLFVNDVSNYLGNESNTNDSTYFKGEQDDDDFERIIVRDVPSTIKFDLSLQKFISKLNGKELTASREPKVDVTPLTEGKKDATYTKDNQTKVKVNVGDIVTYTIRVYNEGNVAGYAEEVQDLLPDGLGLLLDYKDNDNNNWSYDKDDENLKTVKLSTIANATNNVKLDDFENIESLDDAKVLVGKAKITSSHLSSTSEENKLAAFGGKTTDTLSYKDINVTCVVLSDDAKSYQNIAEITKNSDEEKKDVTDIDSTPGSVKEDKYPESELRDDKSYQDDNDDEVVELSKFDLSLQKFITTLNGKSLETSREPKVDVTSLVNGKTDASYTRDYTPVTVKTGDIVKYTIRVYNEGNESGYAENIQDYLPEGLGYIEDYNINVDNNWSYDSSKVTKVKLTSIENAVDNVKLTDFKTVKSLNDVDVIKGNVELTSTKLASTDSNNLLKAFDKENDKALAYKDIEIVCVVLSEDAKDYRNIAEITKNVDENKKEVKDIDSTPNSVDTTKYPDSELREDKVTYQDDNDYEKLVVKEKVFDLSLTKDLVKTIITENGTTTENNVSDNPTIQIKEENASNVTIKLVYNITVKNEGEISGYASEIKDYIPEGLKFYKEDNSIWEEVEDGVISSTALKDKLIDPGKTETIQVVLRWDNSKAKYQTLTNYAEISIDKNDLNISDIDSTPNNKKLSEDDMDDAKVTFQKVVTKNNDNTTYIINNNNNVVVKNTTPSTTQKTVTSTPYTGDNVIVISIAIISVVVILNVVQQITSKKKIKEDDENNENK